ncbi:MAG: EAL domain-containing protein, partial [Pseudomonadota bacterium]
EQFQIVHIPPHKICFEITETAIISDLSNAINFISTLKSLGCQFALDDFGSGLSSFGYLRDLEVDYLKIDGVFVKDILNNPIDMAMVKSISEIGHVMNKMIVAEYVEHESLFEPLRSCGIDFLQGYAIDSPEPLESLADTAPRSKMAG